MKGLVCGERESFEEFLQGISFQKRDFEMKTYQIQDQDVRLYVYKPKQTFPPTWNCYTDASIVVGTPVENRLFLTV